MEEFLCLLLEFQHFQQFINGRIDRLNSNKERDMFDDEVIIYEEELKSGKWSSDQMKVAFKDMKVNEVFVCEFLSSFSSVCIGIHCTCTTWCWIF